MKRIFGILILIIILITVLGCSAQAPIDDITYVELGIPTSSRYSQGIRARCPWDMVVWNDCLYVGSGDYDSNAGPVDIWCYDREEDAWGNTGTVPEEEISRFCIIGNTLVIPGVDPTEDWTYGNYYKFEGDEWIKVRSISGGMHNFDIVEYNGRIFCGLGVAAGEYPIVCSTDNGETFTPIKMYKDGALVDTSGSQNVRVYDLFVFNNNLYATFMYGDTEITYDLYRYENDTFVYDNQWYQKIHQVKHTNNIISGKTEFKGNMFFTTGHLYATSDMANFTRIKFTNSQIVYDLSVYNEKLYALCGEQKENGKYVVSVWVNNTGEATDFCELFNFTYDIPPLSIACHDEGFCFGMGDYNSVHKKNGMILSVDYKISK